MNADIFARAARFIIPATLSVALAVALCGQSALAASAAEPAARVVAGVNLAGGEFGAPPGRIETDYHYPGDAELAWAKDKGFKVVRVPFLWERLQPVLEKELAGVEVERLRAVVANARKNGLAVILDPHNYGRYRGLEIGSAGVPDAAFADFWKRLATLFANQSDVVFGLMNEPHDQPVARWAQSAKAALAAVRSTGACNLTLAPGANWTGAHSWNAERDGVSNASALADLPRSGAVAIEFHQYLDGDSSGMHGDCRKPEEAVAALSVATDWLRKTKHKGFLGEFGAGPDPVCQAGLAGMLKHLNENADVWIGWTYWAGGAWWPSSYPLAIGPGGPERLQMQTLAKWIGASKMPGCGKK